MNIKKIMAMFLALVMVMALVACGEVNHDPTGTTDVSPTESTISSKYLSLFEESIETFMDYLITEVPRESWDEVMSEMPWSYRSINTFNTDDSGLHGDDTWAYYDGEFCVMANSSNFLKWSSNINWWGDPDTNNSNCAFSLEDNTKDGYMLFLLGDYYYYLVEISSTRETHITCLADYTLDGFYTLWNLIANNSNRFMESWSTDPSVNTDVLECLYAFEHQYSLLREYATYITSEEDREEAIGTIDSGYCHDPIKTFLYDQEYRDFTFAILDDGMWDMQYTFNYKNGLYTLGDNYYATVEWHQNIYTNSVADDFDRYRYYEVIDPTQDAYILLNGVETGYTLIRIVAQSDNSIRTPDTDPAYTFDEFNRLYSNIRDNCDDNLAELAETGVLTEDYLKALRINAEDHKELYWYGEQLTGSDYENYQRRKDGGWIDPPFVEIDISGTSEGHLFSYSDGIFTFESPYVEIISTENIADVQWDPYEHDHRHFFIADLNKPAYIETMGEGGYSLYYFIPG